MSEFDAAAYEHVLVGSDDEAKQFSFVIGFLDGALDAVRRAVAS